MKKSDKEKICWLYYNGKFNDEDKAYKLCCELIKFKPNGKNMVHIRDS